MPRKTKILILSDHPFATTGLGTQTNYMIEALLNTGRYQCICLAGAGKYENYQMQKTERWGDDLLLIPVDGYGSPAIVRAAVAAHKPDLFWFMADPRFYVWLWEIADEIRAKVPMIYYHVWDNYPYPTFNKQYYENNDIIVSISKVTYDIVNHVAPNVKNYYIPHTVDTNIFRPQTPHQVQALRHRHFGDKADDLFLCFWNNRNMRRKLGGTLIWWFNEWLKKVGINKAKLIMHTDSNDPHGSNLEATMAEVGAVDGRILISKHTAKHFRSPADLATMYTMCDVSINIAEAEGFGIGTLESLACGTPILVTMTGGLKEQVTDGKHWFGLGIEPSSKVIVGNQKAPFIYEDRITEKEFHDALTKMWKMPKAQRQERGLMGRAHVEKNYSLTRYGNDWIALFDSVVAGVPV